VAAPQHPAVVGWASELVAADDTIRPLIQLLLGRVLVVQEAAVAYELAGQLPPGAVAVTPDGFLAHAGGLVETRPRDPQTSLLAREEAWRQAAAELGQRRTELAQAQATAGDQQAHVEQEQAVVDRLGEEEQQLARQEQEASQRLALAQRDLDRARQQHNFLARQQEANVAEVARLAERVAEVERAMSQYQVTAGQLETALVEARTRLQGLPVAEAREQRRQLQQQAEAAQTIAAGRQAVVDSRRATLNQVDEQLRRRLARLQEFQAQRRQLALEEAQATLERQQAEMDALEGSLKPLRARLAESQATLEQLEEEMARSQKEGHELETHYTQARIALNRRESQVEGLRERIQADLGLVALPYDDDEVGQSPLPIAEVVEELPEAGELPEDIEETIQRYRGQLHRMGAINPDAPAEYAETERRYEFLTQQVEDLNKTQLQLRQVIAELDDLTSRTFAETVKKVDAVFGETFKRLFGGGTAQLVLTEPDDLTISGVDIVARLPSRREQGLGLLSGGERSLTAAALIFALLKVAPTPFCVLDEVDAMLDEANVNRFRELLRELSRQTQFIVITHNRGTVQVAQTVYGVSMGADSTSQVISIRPEDYINGRSAE
ncbi:MAG: hypothetical protein L0322_11835, partial [Chloroflexi bacterium]|nr:hypothetical protein [Chloroflexota bacterium]